MPKNIFSAFKEAPVKHVRNVSPDTSRSTAFENGSLFSEDDLKQSFDTISHWPGYQPTPLLSLSGLARKLNVAAIRYKDEGSRFGLGSFKALGGAYAVHHLLGTSDHPASITVTSATDGNHGLSVAWGAKAIGCGCVIFIHAEVSSGREQALTMLGAEVIRIDGNYDESVRQCYAAAEANQWTVISDTAGDDSGTDVARIVMAGYSVMVAEIVEQVADEVPTHVFVQGGVGGLAATVCEYFRLAWGRTTPQFIVVEPDLAPCLFESARHGRRVSVAVSEETVMAGLSCGVVSAIAWPTLRRFANDFLTLPDAIVAPTMRVLADAPFSDPPIVAGESAVAGLAGFICSRQHADLSSALQLNRDSRVLVIGTEGATDPVLYELMTGHAAASVGRVNI
jgi:diaminopropionate ammonia-lyase